MFISLDDHSPSPISALGSSSLADPRRVLATTAGTFAAAGGLIHFSVIDDHREVALIATGFAVMAVAQLAFALQMLARPSRHGLWLGGALHAGIVALWSLSRTTGIPVIPGAEVVESVGVADVVSTAFSLGVVGLVAIAHSLDRATNPVVLPRGVARRVAAVTLAGTLALSAPALLVPHDPHDHASTADAHEEHGEDPLVPADDHDHDHDHEPGAHP